MPSTDNQQSDTPSDSEIVWDTRNGDTIYHVDKQCRKLQSGKYDTVRKRSRTEVESWGYNVCKHCAEDIDPQSGRAEYSTLAQTLSHPDCDYEQLENAGQKRDDLR